MKYLVLILMISSACVTGGEEQLDVDVAEDALWQDPIYIRRGTCVAESPSSLGWCRTTSPTFEGAYFQGASNAATNSLEFQYQGTIANPAPGVGPRICSIVKRVNDCNLIRPCWYPAAGKLEVWLKSNPGLSTLAQCGDLGYGQFGTATNAPVLTPNATQNHVLRVDLTADKMLFYTDGGAPRVITMSPAVKAMVGPTGVWTNSGAFRFHMDVN